MDELADSTGTGLIARTRLQKGAEPATLAETARLLVAACPGAGRAGGPAPGSLPPGVLAFAAVAAHASGDEAEEARHTQALLDLARGTRPRRGEHGNSAHTGQTRRLTIEAAVSLSLAASSARAGRGSSGHVRKPGFRAGRGRMTGRGGDHDV
jgi:hypothetical protein